MVNTKEDAENYWINVKAPHPDLPIKVVRKGGYACAELTYVISGSGNAENIQVLKSYPDSSYAKEVVRSLKRSKWTAAKSNLSLTPLKRKVLFDAVVQGSENKNMCG